MGEALSTAQPAFAMPTADIYRHTAFGGRSGHQRTSLNAGSASTGPVFLEKSSGYGLKLVRNFGFLCRWWGTRNVSFARSHCAAADGPILGSGKSSNLSNAAKLLRIASKTLRLAAEAGEIEAVHPLLDGPWIFARAALTTSAARSIFERARTLRTDI
jgi:hypothetical protein